VKAAFLLNFTKFVEWSPASFPAPEAPIKICILGEDPFGPTLDQLVDGEIVSGRKVMVERVRRPMPASCRVVYFSEREGGVARSLANLPEGVLTVSDVDGFVRQGGMIGFVIENRRVRFDVNHRAMAARQVRVSSRLLDVARSVVK
jgi:hypothetical protein